MGMQERCIEVKCPSCSLLRWLEKVANFCTQLGFCFPSMHLKHLFKPTLPIYFTGYGKQEIALKSKYNMFHQCWEVQKNCFNVGLECPEASLSPLP